VSKGKQNGSADIVPISGRTLVKRSSWLVQRGLETLALHQDLKPIPVLIVDDIAETRANIRQLLGYASDSKVIGEARNGEEAAKLYEEIIPDVVSMNINMPVMDGITATGIICSKHKDAKIFMLSVQSEVDYMRRAMRAGAIDYIAKPPAAWELVDTIRSLAGRLTPEGEAKREAALQDYLDRMIELQLQGGLRTSKPGDSVQGEAQSLTLTALSGLCGARKGKLLQFLNAADLINTGDAVIDLCGADLKLIRLHGATLRSINLSGANLKGADLRKALLGGAKLSEANLSDSDLNRASLRGATLRKATLLQPHLRDANLREADLHEAVLDNAGISNTNLSGADLRNTKLRMAWLWNANLQGAHLGGADLRGAQLLWTSTYRKDNGTANLSGVILDRADLTGAHVTDEQLASAKSLKGAIMPDGTKHD
jgi:uncharacterized protein YjbI with pentapeptide repeats/FixJ family two-component response regulator